MSTTRPGNNITHAIVVGDPLRPDHEVVTTFGDPRSCRHFLEVEDQYITDLETGSDVDARTTDGRPVHITAREVIDAV